MQNEHVYKVEMGERIRKRRESLGMTREYLSERLDITPKFLADIEYGAKGMSLKVFSRLVQVLNVSADYLLTGDETNNPRLLCEIKFYID